MTYYININLKYEPKILWNITLPTIQLVNLNQYKGLKLNINYFWF